MTHPMRLILGPPVTGDDFFPRDDVIAALHRGLAAEHVLFLAPRRTGKTSLLKAGSETTTVRGESHLHQRGEIHPSQGLDHPDGERVGQTQEIS